MQWAKDDDVTRCSGIYYILVDKHEDLERFLKGSETAVEKYDSHVLKITKEFDATDEKELKKEKTQNDEDSEDEDDRDGKNVSVSQHEVVI